MLKLHWLYLIVRRVKIFSFTRSTHWRGRAFHLVISDGKRNRWNIMHLTINGRALRKRTLMIKVTRRHRPRIHLLPTLLVHREVWSFAYRTRRSNCLTHYNIPQGSINNAILWLVVGLLKPSHQLADSVTKVTFPTNIISSIYSF